MKGKILLAAVGAALGLTLVLAGMTSGAGAAGWARGQARDLPSNSRCRREQNAEPGRRSKACPTSYRRPLDQCRRCPSTSVRSGLIREPS